MNILYITYDGLTDPLGQSQILPYIIGLCKTNPSFEFHIISFEKKQRYNKEKETVKQLINDYNIYWHPEIYTKSPPVFSTVYDIIKMHNHTSKLYRKNRFEIIHCRSYIPALTGLRMKKKYDTKFIFDMRGFWADERVDGKLWNLKNPVYRWIYNYFKKKEKQFLSNADAIVSLTEIAKQEMLHWNIKHLAADKIHVIPCAADFKHFNPEKITQYQKQELRNKLNIQTGDFVLTYLGSLGTWYLLDEMLDFFHLLQKEIPDSKFLFITNDAKAGIMDKAVKRGINKNKIRITSVTRNEVPGYLSLSNWGIFFIKQAYSKMASSPVKMGEFLAMNIPLITNNIGDNQMILKINDSNIIINNLTSSTYEKIIHLIKSRRNINHHNLRNEYFDFLSLNSALNKYNDTYNSIIENN